MKVRKIKFDALLSKVLRTEPEPREKIKTKGRRGPKTPILQGPQSDSGKASSDRSQDS